MEPECCRVDYDDQFNADEARRDVLEYRANGPDPTTRRLLDVLQSQGVQGATLLDIGGGVGAIQLELLSAGVSAATDVDASRPYLSVAEAEAKAAGYAGRVTYLHGDFTRLAEGVAPADIVTLDRVICCYPDVRSLVSLSAGHARRLYGLVHPVDRWWTRALAGLGNLVHRIFRNPYRIYIHSQKVVDGVLAREGFEEVSVHSAWFWRTAVYRRPSAQTDSA